MEDVALWHERDISHSSVERIIAPDVTAALAHMLERAQVLIANLEVDAGRMMQNLQSTGGLVFSEPLMLALVRSGMPKKQAYQLVQRRAHGLSPSAMLWRRTRKSGKRSPGAARAVLQSRSLAAACGCHPGGRSAGNRGMSSVCSDMYAADVKKALSVV
jgi:hypothetical protein